MASGTQSDPQGDNGTLGNGNDGTGAAIPPTDNGIGPDPPTDNGGNGPIGGNGGNGGIAGNGGIGGTGGTGGTGGIGGTGGTGGIGGNGGNGGLGENSTNPTDNRTGGKMDYITAFVAFVQRLEADIEEEQQIARDAKKEAQRLGEVARIANTEAQCLKEVARDAEEKAQAAEEQFRKAQREAQAADERVRDLEEEGKSVQERVQELLEEFSAGTFRDLRKGDNGPGEGRGHRPGEADARRFPIPDPSDPAAEFAANTPANTPPPRLAHPQPTPVRQIPLPQGPQGPH
ncbi:hypothetical protein HK102_011286, partial [Quaeritorhiza haematococci]